MSKQDTKVNMPPAYPGYAQNMPPVSSANMVNVTFLELGTESVQTVCKNCFKEVTVK